MSDHDRLQELLEHAAPERPELDPGSRAAAVARKGRSARRRDRGLIAVAAVAVMAAVVAVPLTLGGDDEASEVANEPTAPTAPPCPAEPLDVGSPTPASALDDVVAVRSCPATWSGATPGSPVIDPLPAAPLLGSAAADFAADVTALPAYSLPDECALMSVMPMPWALVITAADGESTVLGSTVRTCGAVSVGGIDRSAEDVLAAFTG